MRVLCYVRHSGIHVPCMKCESPGCTIICLCLEKAMLFVCAGTVATNFGDYWAVILAFSGIIPHNLVYSGKRTYAISVRTVVIPAGTQVSFWGDGYVQLLDLGAGCTGVLTL